MMTLFHRVLMASVLSLLGGQRMVASPRTEMDWTIVKWFSQLTGESTEPRKKKPPGMRMCNIEGGVSE